MAGQKKTRQGDKITWRQKNPDEAEMTEASHGRKAGELGASNK